MEPVHVVASPTGCGKTTEAAKFAAGLPSVLWLSDRHKNMQAATAAIEDFGGQVGRPLPLRGEQGGVANCLHPDIIETWQAKGYDYRRGFCKANSRTTGPCCVRQGDAGQCPYLAAIDAMPAAQVVVTTQAFARRPSFFTSKIARGRAVILEEDPIGLLRPVVEIEREELSDYLVTCRGLLARFRRFKDEAGEAEAEAAQHMAQWCWEIIGRQPADGQPEAVPVPSELTLGTSKEGVKAMERELFRAMRKDPANAPMNYYRDTGYLLHHAAAHTVFATARCLFFHLGLDIPPSRRVFVLDATANEELLRPIFAPRPVEIVCDQPVQPAGRIIQFMDFNGPRSYLNKTPKKLVQIIDALGDLHREGTIVLISHASCVQELTQASRHRRRIRTTHFGALRGRNDLESRPDNLIACHIVAGSPKTTEEDRRCLALAVYDEAILPFPDLETVRRGVVGRVPSELCQNQETALWEVQMKGYRDPRMQAIYDHTVTAELTHAADRARVLIHGNAVVYLVTNEPCPKLWFSEMCHADEYLDMGDEATRKKDFQRNCSTYEAKAIELLKAGRPIGNADICRAMERQPTWDKRYWRAFLEKHQDALEGERKVRWKTEED